MAVPGTGAMIPAVRVNVETLLLGACDLGLTYRIATGHLGNHEHPDALARTLAGLHEAARPGALLHSTSWRYGPAGVILTYAALPDPDPLDAALLRDAVAVAATDDPLAPCLHRVPPEQVVAHACRHLAWLRQTDPVVAAAAASTPALWSHIDQHWPTLAGQLPQPAATLRWHTGRHASCWP